VNTNGGVKWRRFKVPKKVEQINDNLFIDINTDTYKKCKWCKLWVYTNYYAKIRYEFIVYDYIYIYTYIYT